MDAPAGELIKSSDFFDDWQPDVEAGTQEQLQLEWPDCGAILGDQGSAAVFGSTDVRGCY